MVNNQRLEEIIEKGISISQLKKLASRRYPFPKSKMISIFSRMIKNLSMHLFIGGRNLEFISQLGKLTKIPDIKDYKLSKEETEEFNKVAVELQNRFEAWNQKPREENNFFDLFHKYHLGPRKQDSHYIAERTYDIFIKNYCRLQLSDVFKNIASYYLTLYQDHRTWPIEVEFPRGDIFNPERKTNLQKHNLRELRSLLLENLERLAYNPSGIRALNHLISNRPTILASTKNPEIIFKAMRKLGFSPFTEQEKFFLLEQCCMRTRLMKSLAPFESLYYLVDNTTDVEDVIKGLTVLPRYSLIKKLGEGSDGIVYLAEHDYLGKVKVKMFKDPEDKIRKAMNEEGVTLEDRIRRRISEFDKKIRNKDNLTQLYDVGTCIDPISGEHTIYITSDFVDGGPIESKDKSGRYRIRSDLDDSLDMAALFSTIAGTLYRLHFQGLVLKDFKLANTLLSYDHSTFFIDDLETIAQLTDIKDGKRLTEGSDRYAAPEVIKDPRNASPSSDMYAATVAYLCMRTKNPYLWMGVNILEPREYNKRVEAILDSITFSPSGEDKKFLKKALAYSPKNRVYSSHNNGNCFMDMLRGIQFLREHSIDYDMEKWIEKSKK